MDETFLGDELFGADRTVPVEDKVDMAVKRVQKLSAAPKAAVGPIQANGQALHPRTQGVAGIAMDGEVVSNAGAECHTMEVNVITTNGRGTPHRASSMEACPEAEATEGTGSAHALFAGQQDT